MITHSKTTYWGLASAIGKALTGGGVLTLLTQLFPTGMTIPPGIMTACWYITLFGVVLGAVGTAGAGFFSADAGAVQNVSTEVDRINALGSDPNSKQLVPNVPVKPNAPINTIPSVQPTTTTTP
jgi:hypothetical protein